MILTDRERKSFSLSRALKAAAEGGLKHGLEAEILREATEEAGRSFESRQFTLPWELIGKRDLTAAVAGAAGGVGTDSTSVVDLLRPVSLAVQAGVQVLPGQQGNLSVPEVTASSTAEWLANEAAGITDSESTLDEIAAEPHYCGALTIVSHQMYRQVVDSDFVGMHLLGLIGATLDAAILAGDGVNEPQGVLGLTGVQTVTGTSLALADLTEMEQLSAEENAQPSAYITTPAIRKLLKDREAASGSGFIWQGDRVNGLPGYATTSAPTATLFCGDWAQVLVPLWGAGLQLAVDDSTFFSTGRYQYRVLLGADVVVRHPASFVTASTIT